MGKRLSLEFEVTVSPRGFLWELTEDALEPKGGIQGNNSRHIRTRIIKFREELSWGA